MRLILAGVVVAVHYAELSGISVWVHLDGVAVIAFFFLSGFWIAQLWDTKYTRARNPLVTFYVSRALRIFPMAVVATLLMAGLVGASIQVAMLNLTLFPLKLGTALNPPTWTLAVEAQFYALAPLLLLSRSRWVLALAAAVGGIAWVQFAFGMRGTHMPTFLLPFVLGIAFARAPELHSKAARWSAPSLAVLLLCAAVALLWFNTPSMPAPRLQCIVLSLLALPLVAASVTIRGDSFDRAVGDLAYPLYLLHWPAFVVAGLFTQSWYVPALAIGLCPVFTTVAYCLVHIPVESGRQKWLTSRMIPLRTPDRPRQPPASMPPLHVA